MDLQMQPRAHAQREGRAPKRTEQDAGKAEDPRPQEQQPQPPRARSAQLFHRARHRGKGPKMRRQGDAEQHRRARQHQDCEQPAIGIHRVDHHREIPPVSRVVKGHEIGIDIADVVGKAEDRAIRRFHAI